MSRIARILLGTVICVCTFETHAAPTKPWKDDEDLQRLIRLNKKSLFGDGKVTIVDGAVEILLTKDGHLYSAFKGKNLMDSTHVDMKGVNRGFIQNGDQLLPGLAAVAFGKGAWISRFRLDGEIKVSFEMRIPNLLTQKSMARVRIEHRASQGIRLGDEFL